MTLDDAKRGEWVVQGISGGMFKHGGRKSSLWTMHGLVKCVVLFLYGGRTGAIDL